MYFNVDERHCKVDYFVIFGNGLVEVRLIRNCLVFLPGFGGEENSPRDTLYTNEQFLFSLPLDVNFFVLMILAANSRPVDFCTHLLTTENAPLQRKKTKKKNNENLSSCSSLFTSSLSCNKKKFMKHTVGSEIFFYPRSNNRVKLPSDEAHNPHP